MTQQHVARALIAAGVRTPFAKAGGRFAHLSAVDLGRFAVSELLDRANVRADQVDQLICGNVATPPDAANLARVIALRSGIPRDRTAHTISRNCASGLECVSQAVRLVEAGEADCVVAVGVDSMTNIPLIYNDGYRAKAAKQLRAKSWWQKLKNTLSFRPSDFCPVIGLKLGLTDPYIDMIMGKTAEKLAREYSITRGEQDRFALRSHQRAARAIEAGHLAEETTTVYPAPEFAPVIVDDGVRAKQNLNALEKLPPYFDRAWGTVTVGNSSQVTDGAAAVLVISEQRMEEWKLDPIGRIIGSAYAGCDPERMGLGPVFSTARLFSRTGHALSEMDLIEINEAFAAQVLACEKLFAEPPATLDAVRDKLGTIDAEKMNVNGGAIALGHPVGATGTRLIVTLLNELRRRSQRLGLATLCVGGGQGGSMLVESLGTASQTGESDVS